VDCRTEYPIADGIPVFLDESKSLMSTADIIRSLEEPSEPIVTGLRARLNSVLPNLGSNLAGKANYRHLSTLLNGLSLQPLLLVVGGQRLGEGMDVLFEHSSTLKMVETDIVVGPRTQLVCDAHDLPFDDGIFDGVIVQAVLEHVLDPHRCVEEIYRVLQPTGIVYAETPFIQQVHEGCYDFTRFTHLGHRRLFRRFEEIESGAACGTGMALAWSYRYFLVSLSESRMIRSLLDTFARLTSFFWKYFDRWTLHNRGSYDAASAYYFLGRKSEIVLSDRELVRQYRGQN
jgi:SAM-dependent methyltransferase